MRTIVYGASWCKPCKDAIRWLKSKGLAVDEMSYEKAPVEVRGLPLIKIGEQFYHGFNPKVLQGALNKHFR